MPIRLKLYLDTSVISTHDDDRDPKRRDATRDFWERCRDHYMVTSVVAENEINATPDPLRRMQMLELLAQVRIIGLEESMRLLARRYVQAGIFTGRMRNDARHIAAAVLGGHDILVSWNFRHLVNRSRRARLYALNADLGLPEIEILSPLEVYADGDDD